MRRTVIPVLPGRVASRDLVLLGQGRERVVYGHRDMPDRVFKILHPGAEHGERTFFREFHAQKNAVPHLAPIPALLGMQATEMGRAQVTERISDADGDVAPSLEALAGPAGLPGPLLVALNEFVRRVYAARLVGHDFAPKNILYGVRPGEAEAAFVQIDGFGDRQRHSRKELFGFKLTRSLDRELGKIARRTALRWNPVARAFANPA